MSTPDVSQLAKQGDPKAIAMLINRHLQPQGITAKVSVQKRCLFVFLESQQILDQMTLTAFIKKGIIGLNLKAIDTLKIYSKQTNEEFPAWIEEVTLSDSSLAPAPSISMTPRTSSTRSSEIKTITVSGKNQSSFLEKFVPTKFRIPGKILVPISTLVALIVCGAAYVGWTRSEQSKIIAEAKGVITNVKAKEGELNTNLLKDSQKQLNSAIALLETVPNAPGSLYSVAQRHKSNAKSKLENVDQKLKTVEQLQSQVKSTLAKFNAVNSRLDVGMNYRKYGDEVRELKVALDELSQQPNAENLPATKNLTEAFEEYEFAYDVWQYYIESDASHNFFPASSSYGTTLVGRYGVSTRFIVNDDYIYLNNALSAVWQKAQSVNLSHGVAPVTRLQNRA